MAYNIITTTGASLATVPDGTVNTTATSLALIGKNYAGYGIFLNENYIKLLENFANTTEPNAPIKGQMWYDTANSTLKVYDGSVWKPISSSANGSTAPAGVRVVGDLWWDSASGQLKAWSGSSWILVGPLTTTSAGTSGPAVETISDGSSSHIAIKFYISNVVVAIFSKDATYTPATSITGFTVIEPGLNLAATSGAIPTGTKLAGTANNSSYLNGFTSSDFLKKNTAETTSATFAVQNNSGFTVGASNNFNIGVVGSAVRLTNTVTNSDVNFFVQYGGTPTRAININGTTLAVTVDGALRVTGSITPSSNAAVNIGGATSAFANVYAVNFVGTSIQARYADLAERFEADVPMVPGTVVELGGVKEITAAVQELSEAVFGVISTLPGFLLNGGAGTDATHPAIAVNGRVPVRVIGCVKKGDRLVSAGNGLARAAHRNEMTAFNVIGRALSDKNTSSEGLVEAIVKLNS